ncbi:MAG: hypothetical protein U0V70_10235 [Terriglobia bacterium]
MRLSRFPSLRGLLLVAGLLILYPVSRDQAANDCDEKVTVKIRLEEGHAWRPPFGLDRIGQPLNVVIEVESEERPYREYWVVTYQNGKEIDRQIFHLAGSHLTGKSPYLGRASFAQYFDEVALFAKCRFQGEPVELARQKVTPPPFQAEALTRLDPVINPVDLGTVLVPLDWLLLSSGQKGQIEVAAISRAMDIGEGKVQAWFESAAGNKSATGIKLEKDRKSQVSLPLPSFSGLPEKDNLHISLQAGDGKELWQKRIPVMMVKSPLKLPEFGASELKLRFDAPISVRDPRTGKFSTMSYDTAWAPQLKDVIVSLPNGSRYVFWRGSCYIPFWASLHDMGMSYEWAETTPPADGFTDSVEPLMDKELRYGRVEVFESTPARVHVRWTYQSTDFTYKVWGDAPVEDYYFYPDSMGTRVLSLTSAPGAKYEVQEMIVLGPQMAYPYQVLNPKMVDILFIDGEKREITFPPEGTAGSSPQTFSRQQGVGAPRDVPAVYRVRLHKEDADTAFSFNPVDTHLPQYLFSPFYDRGVMVTPAYWGSHWPVARGNTTGWTIDDRIALTPSHNSILSWGLENQTPLKASTFQTIDTLGRSKLMTQQQYVWLIGMTSMPDARLLEWAYSFKNPPSLELKGARLEQDQSYVSERRAMRLVVEDPAVTITVKPSVRCINPVFELRSAPKVLRTVKVGERMLTGKEFAWDGHVLWIQADIATATPLQLEFASTGK